MGTLRKEVNKTDEKIMTPEEFAEYMQFLHDLNEHGDGYDKEWTHIGMDALMCELLRDLGYKKGIEIFDKTSKWYS